MREFILKVYKKDLEDKNEEELAEKYGYFFCYLLSDAWGLPQYWILLFDKDKDNAIIFDNEGENVVITLSKNEISDIKNYIINNSILFEDLMVAYAPVLDGTTDNIVLSINDKKVTIYGHNLWYWFAEDAIKLDDNDHISEESKEYTKAIIDLLAKVQSVLKKRNIVIDFYLDED